MSMIYGRSAWKALPPNWAPTFAGQVDTFVCHHSDTAQPMSAEESIAQVQAIQRDHLTRVHPDGTLQFGDIAYNVIAGHDCAIVGRGVDVTDGATDTDPSTLTWSVCVLGDYTKDLLTTPMRAGLLTALSLGLGRYGVKPLRPHNAFCPTGCPGTMLIDALPGIESTYTKEPTMTPDEYFAHQLKLNNPQDPAGGQTDIAGWHVFMHQELNLLRIAVENLVAALLTPKP